MAICLNYDDLKRRVDAKAGTSNQQKGDSGELQAIELLCEHFDNQTILIWQPTLNTSSPDILIISPDRGFIIVEVKNWRADYIWEIKSNGKMKLNNNLEDPIGQAEIHAKDLSDFLSANLSEIENPFKVVSHFVFFPNLSQSEFTSRSEISSWSGRQRNAFFKKHMFKDNLPLHGYKKSTEDFLDKEVIEEVVQLLEPFPNQSKDSTYKEGEYDTNREFYYSNNANEMTHQNQTEYMKNEQSNKYIPLQRSNTALWLMGTTTAILLLILIATNFIFQPDYTEPSFEEDVSPIGEADVEGLVYGELNDDATDENVNPSSDQKSIDNFKGIIEEQDPGYETSEDVSFGNEESVTENDNEKPVAENYSTEQETLEEMNDGNPVGESLPSPHPDSIQSSSGTFTIGSTKDQVKAIMGPPSSVESILNMWRYDMSSVEFDDQDRVIGWNNLSHNLSYSIPADSAAEFITTGSTKEDVVAVMGAPSSIEPILNTWRYDLSSIEFNEQNQVEGWNDLSNNLVINIPTEMTASTFTLGSPKEEVLSAMGTPSSIEPILNTWRYDLSSVKFDDQDRVEGWNDLSNNLNIK